MQQIEETINKLQERLERCENSLRIAKEAKVYKVEVIYENTDDVAAAKIVLDGNIVFSEMKKDEEEGK